MRQFKWGYIRRRPQFDVWSFKLALLLFFQLAKVFFDDFLKYSVDDVTLAQVLRGVAKFYRLHLNNV